MLALRMTDHPALLVMDEPTNHMDLPSIECLESALGDYGGGLLLVSHDQRFLAELCTITWEIQPDEASASTQRLSVRQNTTRKPGYECLGVSSEPMGPRRALTSS